MSKLFFAVGATACMVAFSMLAGCDKGRNAEVSVRTVRVDTVRQSRETPALAYPARVKAADYVGLAFKISGTLKRVFVGEGESVSRGMLLAELDSRDYEVLLDAAKAEYEGVRADAERAFALYADSVATAADYDKARYGLERIKAKYDNARNMVADTRLYAPFDGVVEHRLLNAPAVVGAGMPVMTVLSDDLPEVEINVPASTRSRIDGSTEFRARFDYTDIPVCLSLISAAPNANANQLYKVRLALPQGMGNRPAVGMSAMVYVEFGDGAKRGEVTVPASAVFEHESESAVWVYADGKVVRRRVKLGALHTDGTATIAAGLSRGEWVVTAGTGGLKENQRVKPMGEMSVTNTGGLL